MQARSDRRPARRALGVLVVVAGVTLAAPPARAGSRDDEAAAAYERGARAYDRGDFATAAVELARADELAPKAVALELALAAVLKTDDAVLGMTLAERAETRGPSKALDASARAATRKFGGAVGKLDVVCAAPTACTALVDAAPFPTGVARWLPVGSHKVAIVRDGTPEEHAVSIEPGKTVQLVATRAAAPSPSPSASAAEPTPPRKRAADRDDGGLSPVWFWIGTGASVALGAASAISGVDTVNKHNAFLADRSNAAAADAGRAADLRTSILLVATGVAAVATATVGIVFVRWSDGSGRDASVGLAGERVFVRAAF